MVNRKRNDLEFLFYLQNALRGNKEAFGKLSELYMPMFKSLCFQNEDFDDDLYQELLLYMFQKLPRFSIERIYQTFVISKASTDKEDRV